MYMLVTSQLGLHAIDFNFPKNSELAVIGGFKYLEIDQKGICCYYNTTIIIVVMEV